MSDDERGRDLLVRGIAAAKAGSKDEARFFLLQALRQDVAIASRVQAWRYLSELSDDPAEKRRYIGQILAVDPLDGLARRELALLDGRLKTGALVDPEHIPRADRSSVVATGGPALTCRRCGSARLVLAPGGRTLVCEHCHAEEPIDVEHTGTVADHDFIAAMWTLRGHRAPVATRCFTCRGCGASFALAPAVLSFTCAYCGSVHVNEPPAHADLIQPDALLTGSVSAEDALHNARRVLADAAESSFLLPVGVYVPFWMFRFGGEIRWSGIQRDESDSAPAPVSGSHAVVDLLVVVCAGGRLPELARDATDQFDFRQLLAYDPRLLAGWLAETYEITLEQAALASRRASIDKIRTQLAGDLDGIADLELSSAHLAIDTFNLVLLPFWIVRFTDHGTSHMAIVNGQSGVVSGDRPPKGPFGWLTRLFPRT